MKAHYEYFHPSTHIKSKKYKMRRNRGEEEAVA
jgi:hypothetical protein